MRQQLSIRVVHLQCMHPRSLLHGALPSSLRFVLAADLSLTLLHLSSTHGFSRWDDDLDRLSPVALVAGSDLYRSAATSIWSWILRFFFEGLIGEADVCGFRSDRMSGRRRRFSYSWFRTINLFLLPDHSKIFFIAPGFVVSSNDRIKRLIWFF